MHWVSHFRNKLQGGQQFKSQGITWNVHSRKPGNPVQPTQVTSIKGQLGTCCSSRLKCHDNWDYPRCSLRWAPLGMTVGTCGHLSPAANVLSPGHTWRLLWIRIFMHIKTILKYILKNCYTVIKTKLHFNCTCSYVIPSHLVSFSFLVFSKQSSKSQSTVVQVNHQDNLYKIQRSAFLLCLRYGQTWRYQK